MADWFVSLGHAFDYEQGRTPFSHWLWPVSGGVLYLVGLKIVQDVVRNRGKPFNLPSVFPFVHNVFLCLLSVSMAAGLFIHAIRRASDEGVMAVLCPREPGNYMNGGLYFWTYIFHLSKYYEFLDTMITVLHGRSVLHLHIYHHAVMPLLTWMWLVGNWPLQWYGCFVNSCVHVIMYFYYALKSIGIDVWWKRYVTSIQIIQFCIVFLLIWVFWGLSLVGTRPCVGSLWVTSFSQMVNISFLVLFVQFYLHTYKGRREKSTPKQKEPEKNA